ncbi:MAG: GntR family transcriptional regulator [Chloroflexi bacterium]|nr:GntR family transcriptional regulator [Chloroflexota bacterium]
MTDQHTRQNYTALTRREHQSLADIAYNALVAAIVNQDFEPGAQLSIDGLAKQLEMSNTPVREALMRTNGERLVQQKTNYGFVVAPLLTVTELHQLFDLRYVLETHALSLAELPNPLVDELENLVCQLDEVSDGTVYSDFKDYLLIDHSFHRTLVSMSGNSFLLKAWEDLHVHLHLSRLYTGVGLIDRELLDGGASSNCECPANRRNG